jgi:hypothetical protein
MAWRDRVPLCYAVEDRGAELLPSRRAGEGARPLAMAPADTYDLRGYGLGSAASTSNGATRHVAGAVVTEISLLGAAAGVRKREPQRCALSFTDFLTAVVADENGLTGQGGASFYRKIAADLSEIARGILCSSARFANAPRTKQREECALLRFKVDIVRSDDA